MDRVKLQQLLSEMTLTEKVGQLVQLTPGFFGTDYGELVTDSELNLDLNRLNVWEVGSVLNLTNKKTIDQLQHEYLAHNRLNIPLLFMNDMIYGYKNVFPIPLALAGSHDANMIEAIGGFLGQEAAADGAHVVFSPMLDLVRDPRWGGVMESPGEDVHTVKAYGRALVAGIQGNYSLDAKIDTRHVATAVKHYAGYGAVEAGREYSAVDISNFSLMNTYLPGYLAAVEAGAKLVMTAFSVINGMPVSVDNWLLGEVLRTQAKFSGVVISDYNALNELITLGYSVDELAAAKAALTAGVDIDMMATIFTTGIVKLINENALDINLVDQAVLRVLDLKNDLGLFENPYRGFDNTANEEEFTQLSIQATTESSVLLKNTAHKLPLAKEEHVALIGPMAASPLILGFGGSINADFSRVKTLKASLTAKNYHFSYAKGYNMTYINEPVSTPNTANIQSDAALLTEALNVTKNIKTVILTIGEDSWQTGEGASKTDLTLADNQINLIKQLHAAGKQLIGVIYTGRPLVLTEVEPYFDALLLVWYPGTNGGLAITDMLFGTTTPSGKLAMTWPRNVGQIPIHYDSLPTGRPLTKDKQAKRFVSKYLDSPNTPLYPFGHGLTYHQNQISCELQTINYQAKAKIITIECLIASNDLPITDVLQVYVQQPKMATVILPKLKLVATKRIKQQKAHTVKITIPVTELAYFDNQGQQQLVPGEYTFSVGLSSTQMLATAIIKI